MGNLLERGDADTVLATCPRGIHLCKPSQNRPLGTVFVFRNRKRRPGIVRLNRPLKSGRNGEIFRTTVRNPAVLGTQCPRGLQSLRYVCLCITIIAHNSIVALRLGIPVHVQCTQETLAMGMLGRSHLVEVVPDGPVVSLAHRLPAQCILNLKVCNESVEHRPGNLADWIDRLYGRGQLYRSVDEVFGPGCS